MDLVELRWEHMPSLACRRVGHACCAVRGGVVVLGGLVDRQHERTASVEILGREAIRTCTLTVTMTMTFPCSTIM